MPAPSPVSSPCADARRQRGAAVILALLTMSFAAIVAAAALADFNHGYEALAGRSDQARSRQLARSAVDWARSVLAEDDRNSAVDHRGESWAIPIPPTPLGSDPAEGTLGGAIEELSGRFNLNDLAPAGRANEAARQRLQTLLEILGEAPPRAQAATQALSRWISTTPAAADDRAPHAPLLSPAELVAVPGWPPELVERVLPFAATLPAPAVVNLNTAPAEVLAALVPGLDLDAARTLVAGRERAWFRDLADFTARLPAGASAPPDTLADVRSRHFLVTVHARYGVALTRLEALLDRGQRWPSILWYRSS